MSALTIDLPDEVEQRIERVARSQGVSVKEFILKAADEMAAAVTSLEELGRRAAAARQEVFDEVMAAVPDVEPPEWDQID